MRTLLLCKRCCGPVGRGCAAGRESFRGCAGGPYRDGSHCTRQRQGGGAKRRLAAAAACLAPQQHGPPTPYCSRLTCSAQLLLEQRYMLA